MMDHLKGTDPQIFGAIVAEEIGRASCWERV